MEKVYAKKIFLTRLVLVLFIFMAGLPMTVGTYKADEKNNTTTSTVTESQNVDDIDVSLKTGKDGKTKLDIKGMKGDSDSTWNTIIKKYHTIIIALTAIAFLTMVAVIFILCTKMSVYSDKPNERSRVIGGLIVSIIACAIAGAATIIVSLAWNALR